MASIADGIPAGIRLPTRKPPCQISKCVQLLSIKSSIMPCHAPIIWAFTAKVVIVAEFLMSKPCVDRFQRFDWQIDSLSNAISIDDWFRPANLGSMLEVTEDALE